MKVCVPKRVFYPRTVLGLKMQTCGGKFKRVARVSTSLNLCKTRNLQHFMSVIQTQNNFQSLNLNLNCEQSSTLARTSANRPELQASLRYYQLCEAALLHSGALS